VHGPNLAHGCSPVALAACGAGRTGPLAFPTPDRSGPLVRWPTWHAPGARSPRERHMRWRGRQRLIGGQGAARSWARAPRLSGGCAGQGDRRRGLP
jgi:hypothetical protein